MSDSFSAPTSSGAPTSGPKPPLGVGGIVGDSFSILFRHFLAVMILGFVPVLAGRLISGLLVGWTASMRAEEGVGGFGPILLNAAVQIVVNGLIVALLVQLAYDAKLGRKMRLRAYVSPALRAAVPIAVLSLVVGILTGLGIAALIVPGLWVYAVFSVMPAAVVIDRAGFGGLGRSVRLTKAYRWPIAGALIVVILCSLVLNFVGTFLAGMILGATGSGILVAILLISAFTAVSSGLSSIAVALIYARLREIKEGASLSDIVAVFD